VQYQQAWMDERGWLYLTTSGGLGLVHTQDVGVAAQAIERGLWFVSEVSWDKLMMWFPCVQSPQHRQKKGAGGR
jgi:hypothetical protein